MYYAAGADPGIFVRGGVQPSEKNLISIKKNDKGGEEGHFSIYSALVRTKSNLFIEIAFKIIIVHKMTSPVFSSHPEHI